MKTSDVSGLGTSLYSKKIYDVPATFMQFEAPTNTCTTRKSEETAKLLNLTFIFILNTLQVFSWVDRHSLNSRRKSKSVRLAQNLNLEQRVQEWNPTMRRPLQESFVACEQKKLELI